MATVAAVVIPSQKKTDGTWNVKIRVNKDSRSSYIETTHYVNAKQLRKKNLIKDPLVLAMVEPVLNNYRIKIGELGPKLEAYDAIKLAKHLAGKKEIKAEEIKVIEFGRKRIAELRKLKRNGSADNMRTVVNGLVDFFGTEDVRITDLRSKMLEKYEEFLRNPRQQKRPDQFQREQTRSVNGLSDSGLHNHMRDLRILFNNIKDHYNDEDEDLIVIKHYPFKKYKLVPVKENEKPKLTVEQVIAIRDYEAPAGTRVELARDLFMLSFYLCGMNAVDIYKIPAADEANPRIGYKRSKTQGRRRDQAYISICIPDIARPLYEKYAGTFQKRYVDHYGLDHALSFGMQRIGADLKFDNLEFYDARHAFGDLARNKARFSKDDVALALNHKDQSNRVTDIYVSKNWDIIDDVQTGVIKLLEAYDWAKQNSLDNDGFELPTQSVFSEMDLIAV